MAQDSSLLNRLEALEQKLNSLAQENASLKQEVVTLRADAVRKAAAAPVPASADAGANTQPSIRPASNAAADAARWFSDTIGINSAYAFKVLDQAVNVNTKPLIQLEALRSGGLTDRVTLSGQVTAIANYQWSNRASKFGYQMRNPTSANQIGDNVSEVVLHSANVAVTARLINDVTAYAELLYDP